MVPKRIVGEVANQNIMFYYNYYVRLSNDYKLAQAYVKFSNSILK